MRVAAWLAAAATFAGAPAAAQTARPYAWIQYGADGRAQVRAVPLAAACPLAMIDGKTVPLTRRVEATPAFERVLCAAVLPARAASVRIGEAALPRIPHAIKRIAVLGDTGCRIKGPIVQDCNDPAAWPFARIARTIAREHPDLIVHVGDYLYREAACPFYEAARCANTPYGDNWAAWEVDFFAPAAPLFAAAPIVFVRGNHEDCERAGLGWSRYLAPEASAVCREHEATAAVSFDDLRLANVDSAAGDENNPDPAPFERDERDVDASARGRETWLLTHRPPLAYLAAHSSSDPNGPHLSAILAGHVHAFVALTFSGAPPTVIVGTGGDRLSTQEAPVLAEAFHAVAEARFGYALFERVRDGWTIDERDADGTEHRRCILRRRSVRC